jgi:disulfide bond formation protein DsbB
MQAMPYLALLLRPYWPLVALVASGALLAAAHAFERFGGLAPCALCLDQREWHWGVVGSAALGFVVLRFRPGLSRWVAAVLGLVLLGSFAMASYHVAVEQHWVSAQCEADPGGLSAFDVSAPLVVPSCDTPAWTMFAISMAGYNALISLALALASFVIAFTPAPRDE